MSGGVDRPAVACGTGRRNVRCAGLLFLLASLAATSAAADVLDIPGSYGSPAGCKFLKTNDYSDETLVVLTPGQFQTYASLCEFLQVLKPADGSSVVTALCANEGEAEQSIEFMRVVKSADGTDAYEVHSQAGDLQAKVERCS